MAVMACDRPMGQNVTVGIRAVPTGRLRRLLLMAYKRPLLIVAQTVHHEEATHHPLFTRSCPSVGTDRCPVAQPGEHAIRYVARSAQQIRRTADAFPEHAPAQKCFRGRTQGRNPFPLDIPPQVACGHDRAILMGGNELAPDVPPHRLINRV